MLNYSKQLGDAVRRARNSLNLTQAQAADRANIDPRTVLNIENYKGNPKFAALVSLVRNLRIDPNDIFFPEAREESPFRQQLRIMVDDCDETEAKELIPILEAVIRALRRQNKYDV